MDLKYQNVVAVDEDSIEVCEELPWRWEVGSKVFTDNLKGTWTCIIFSYRILDINRPNIFTNNSTMSVFYQHWIQTNIKHLLLKGNLVFVRLYTNVEIVCFLSITLSMVKVWKYMNGLAKNILMRKFQILCQKFMLWVRPDMKLWNKFNKTFQTCKKTYFKTMS